MGLPPKVYQVFVGLFAALGSFLYGYDLTIVAEGIASLKSHLLHHAIDILLCSQSSPQLPLRHNSILRQWNLASLPRCSLAEPFLVLLLQALFPTGSAADGPSSSEASFSVSAAHFKPVLLPSRTSLLDESFLAFREFNSTSRA